MPLDFKRCLDNATFSQSLAVIYCLDCGQWHYRRRYLERSLLSASSWLVEHERCVPVPPDDYADNTARMVASKIFSEVRACEQENFEGFMALFKRHESE